MAGLAGQGTQLDLTTCATTQDACVIKSKCCVSLSYQHSGSTSGEETSILTEAEAGLLSRQESSNTNSHQMHANACKNAM